MLDGASLPDIQGLDLTYKPEMGTMNSLALPENLPLDFIASKISNFSKFKVLLWSVLVGVVMRADESCVV